MSDIDIILRLGLAVLGGLVLGLDREMRGIAAGIRTHALVGLSSASITVSALLLYQTLSVQDGVSNLDPLRVIQRLAQAIGFIAAGAIFVAGGSVQNLTSAANLWLAAALGIASGAGQFVLFAASLTMGIVLLAGLRIVERRVLSHRNPEDRPGD